MIKTADILPFKLNSNNKICILLGTRKNETQFSGKICIPGGKLKPHEDSKTGAIRELKEETNLDVSSISDKVRLIDIYYPDPSVDWKKSKGVLYSVVLPDNFEYELIPQSNEMSDVRWYEIGQIPYDNMAFDHDERIKKVINFIFRKSI